MNEREMRDNAREKMKGTCRVCPCCDGKACAGEVPGMGGLLTGSAFKNNIEALSMYHINLRTMHQIDQPDTTVSVFGRKFATPVFVAPLTGASYNMGGALSEEEMVSCLVQGAGAAGSFSFTGDGAETEIYAAGLQAIKSAGGLGIPIIKPRSMEAIADRIRQAEESGAFAVGIDLDGAGLVTMAMKGQPVAPKSFYQLRDLVNSTKLPFILKGIMTAQEAEMAVELGAAAIVISNHGGRILDGTPGVAEVLPEIVERVKGEIFIFADGGVRNGIDALKMMALGANAVLIGRPSVWGAFGGGAGGVTLTIEKMTEQLRHGMLMTGCVNIKAVDYHVIY
ncbi:MAG: alpha-hydroxy-acid oxidizing protein [Bacillota bacterium]|nr:alpha-hydroxy-acid oxidizing protein [Bacillota bacterium]MDW7682924.1 alpha-hydroxy-acid oxidizing protein [Bacillota bacterium]